MTAARGPRPALPGTASWRLAPRSSTIHYSSYYLLLPGTPLRSYKSKIKSKSGPEIITKTTTIHFYYFYYFNYRSTASYATLNLFCLTASPCRKQVLFIHTFLPEQLIRGGSQA